MSTARPIADQVVVIFGASSGIGRESALRFGRRGAKVLVAGRDEQALESVAAEIRSQGGTASVALAEATDAAALQQVAENAVQQFGRLDTWVHVAAVYMTAAFDQTTPAEFKRIVDVNLTGAAYGAMAALPALKRQGRGRLIFLSSIEGRVAIPLQAAYAASKHGVQGLAEALRLELQYEGFPITVTTISPSTINTPLFEKARTKLGVQPRGLPPIYEPCLVADAVLYAAEHGAGDIVVGGAGKMLDLLHRISPALSATVLRHIAFQGQRTDKFKPANSPSNLFQHMPGLDQIKGNLPGLKRHSSTYTWMRLHPQVTTACAGALAAATVFLTVSRHRLKR